MRVGIDIGGTKTDAVALDREGAVVQRLRVETRFGSRGVLESAVEAVTRLAALEDVGSEVFDSIGVGIPGAVDRASGKVTNAVNLGVSDLDLGPELSERFHAPVIVENDVNAAALGVFHLHRDVGASAAHSMAYLNLGTGMAAGLVLNGELWRGSRGTAGEIGHIPVDPTGPVCACGQHGCLETMASGSAVARMWPTDNPHPVQALFEAADDGDRAAMAVRTKLTENIAAAVRVLMLSIDVDIVVIGGGLSLMGDVLLDGTRSVLRSWALESPFLASLDLPERVELLPSGYPAGAVGAALVATRVRDKKGRRREQRDRLSS